MDTKRTGKVNTTDNPIALIEVRNQRLFGPKAVARFLGICEDTLKKISDLGQIRAFNMNGRRAYRLEDLVGYIESIPEWYDSAGEKLRKDRARQETLMIFEDLERGPAGNSLSVRSIGRTAHGAAAGFQTRPWPKAFSFE